MIPILQFRQIHRVHADECGGAESRRTLLYHNSRPTRQRLSFPLIMVERRDARILVVDDDEQLAALLVLVLEGEGYPVTVASDAAGAIDEVKKGAPDLVVLDISLGADDGRMVLSQIRELGELPVILISGKGDTADRVLGLRLGADDYLPKPFSPVELVARVESVAPAGRSGPARRARTARGDHRRPLRRRAHP